jgi:hypothetical protein
VSARHQDTDDGFAKPAPPTLEERPEKDAEGPAGGVVGGVVGGVEGGVPGGVAGGKEKQETADKRDLADSDNLRARALQKSANEITSSAPASPPKASAKGEVRARAWSIGSDSGVVSLGRSRRSHRGDGARRIALDVGGFGVSRNVGDGGPYVLVVPRERFEEVFYALRARGIAGFGGPPRLPEGTGCAGISLTLQTRRDAPPR